MNRILILTALFFLAVVMVSGGGDDSSEKSGFGESCTKTSDCEGDLKCIDLVCVSDSGDTGDTGDTDDTADTGDTGDSGDTGNTSDNFPNEHDGLNWSDASSYYMNWSEAVAYCENLGGRLPTISELRTLIQNCPGTGTGGQCGVTNDCLSADCRTDPCYECEYSVSGKYSVFGDTSRFWSSSELSDYAGLAWLVHFSYGYVYYNLESSYYDVRCVH